MQNIIPLSGYNRNIKIDVNEISNKDIVILANLVRDYNKNLLIFENDCFNEEIENKIEYCTTRILNLLKKYTVSK